MSSKVDHRFLKKFCLKYGIHPKYNPTAPQSHHRITDCPDGYIALYTKHLECSNIRIPFSNFFLDFLKHYKVNISQLSPLAVMRVSHFEIMCRALGGEPSLPLFRRFFILIRNGDCYAVSLRSSGCISSVSTSLNQWRDSFFWVSAEAVPFKMGWRRPSEQLNVIPRNSEKNYDEKLYKLLVNHPTPLQRFPEHVLVMCGISRNWPHSKAEPVIKDGDQEIDLLEYIEKEGVGNAGDMKLTSRSLGEHEVHILERTKGICYDVTSSEGVEIPDEVLQSEVQGTSGGDLEIHPEKPKQKTIIGSETVSELPSSSKKMKNAVVITIDDSPAQSSDETAPNTHVEEAPVASAGNKRRRGKQIVFTDESSSDHYEVGQTSMDQEYVPESVPEALEKELENARAESVEHAYEKLKQANEELEIQREMVKKLNGELKLEKDGRRQECESLKKSLEQVLSERQWLIQEGFDYVINRLHKSPEYLGLLGAVQSNLWDWGAHYGLVQCYESCKDGVALKDASLYNPGAHERFLKAVHELENTRFPYVVALSQCAERSLDELRALEPIGLEKDVDEAAVGGGSSGGDQ